MDPADSCTPGIATTDGRSSARSLTGAGKPPRYGPTVPWAASARACSRVSGAFQYDGVAGRPHHGGEMPKTQRAGAFARILAIVVTVVIGSAMHAQAQTAEAPVWKVGYKWTFHRCPVCRPSTRFGSAKW